jgi:hypothetical protein
MIHGEGMNELLKKPKGKIKNFLKRNRKTIRESYSSRCLLKNRKKPGAGGSQL